MKKTFIFLLTVFSLAAVTTSSPAEPERIRPGISYYSDDYTVKDGIARLGEERNIEEVYKNYEYYEAVYDELKRIVLFRAYKRGEVDWTERYFYDGDGRPLKKEVVRPGLPAKVIRLQDRK